MVMMMDSEDMVVEWLLIKEIADITGVAENTLRRYADLFSEFFVTKKYGRSTKYSSNSIEIFKTIYSLYEVGHSTDEIREQMSKENLSIIEVESKSNDVTTVPQQLLMTMASIDESLKSMRDEIKVANANQKEIESLRREVDELKKIISEQQEILNSKKSFWAKLFGK